MSLNSAILIDVLTVPLCGLVLARWASLRHSHPAVIYLAFHVVMFTIRAVGVSGGDPTFLGATQLEIARALNLADLALVAATVGWVVAANGEQSARRVAKPKWLELSGNRIMAVGFVAIPVGLFTLARYAYIPGAVNPENVATSTYSTLAITWPSLIIGALIYRYGFKIYLAFPMFALLSIMALQGHSRFRVVLPAILLIQIYLDRKGKRWPGPKLVALLMVGLLLFFPLKTIGQETRAGSSVGEIVSAVQTSLTDPLRGTSDGQGILDQLALTLTLTDQHGKVFWGRPYLNVLVLPVPRSMWEEKPGLADHIKEISTAGRPIGPVGAATTMVGDLYMNFRTFGVVLGTFILGLISGRLFRRAYSSTYLSMYRFGYLLLAASTIQIARDGVISILVFVLVQSLPLVAIIALHWRVLASKTSPSLRAVVDTRTISREVHNRSSDLGG